MALKYYFQNKAFALLELIIATAILSAGIVFVLQALSFSARTTGLAGDIIKAVFLAEDKLQELELKEKQGLIKDEPKQDKEDSFNWQYSAILDPVLNLYKLNFNISWQWQNRKQDLNINTYLKNAS